MAGCLSVLPGLLLSSITETRYCMSVISCRRRRPRGDLSFLLRTRPGRSDTARAVRVVVVPPRVRRSLRIALRRVFPRLLAAERRDVQVTPGASHRLVTPAVNEVRPVDPLAVANECVVAVPLVHAEVLVKVVGEAVPRDQLPAHALLQALDLGLRG